MRLAPRHKDRPRIYLRNPRCRGCARFSAETAIASVLGRTTPRQVDVMADFNGDGDDENSRLNCRQVHVEEVR